MLPTARVTADDAAQPRGRALTVAVRTTNCSTTISPGDIRQNRQKCEVWTIYRLTSWTSHQQYFW
jgi:hypothetical protein